MLRSVAAAVADRLQDGHSLRDALEPYRSRFPPLFLELIAVGERTGRLDDACRELEHYYETALGIQRTFRSQLVYPAVQFVVAVLVIAGLIVVLGVLAESGRAVTTDPTGLGLTGTRGAVLFLVLAFGSVGAILLAMKLAAEHTAWRARLEGGGLWLPAWGPALLTLALHRFAVALRMGLEAGLSADKTLRHAFRATCNAAFQAGEPRAVRQVKRGRTFGEALDACEAPFPEEFRQMVHWGDETGNLAEVMDRLADRYREEAGRRLAAAARLTAWGIYVLVALLIVLAIFQIAGLYLGAVGAAG